MAIMRTLVTAAVAAAALLPAAAPAAPEGKGADKGAQQARRLQQQLRAAEKEKSELAAQKLELETRLKEARDSGDDTRRQVAREAQRSARIAREVEALKGEKAELERSLAAEREARAAGDVERAAAERRFAAQRGAFDQDRRRFEAVSAEQAAFLGASRERNERMYALGLELVARWEGKTCTDAMLQAEPFTGLRRAQIEKMAEQEREKFDRERLPYGQASPRFEVAPGVRPTDDAAKPGVSAAPVR